MRIISLLILIFIVSGIQAQNLTDFELVDNYKLDNSKVKVYFKDPLKELLKKHPDFDNKDDKTKHELLSDYLHNNTLYVFQTFRKKKLQKSYELKGNPKKIRTKYYFNLDILEADGTLDKAIDKVNIGGSFFEHMFIFQTTQGKKVIGKGIKMWGYFVMIEPYDNIKLKITELIEKDLENAIPDEILVKQEIIIEPLFDYQNCGLKTISKREFTITVYQYDSLGHKKNEYPRTETDSELYLSSTSKDLIGVTTFPFFASTDKKVVIGNKIQVESELENIKHYLKDIEITTDSNKIVKIEGKLIIHGYTTKGETTHYELYISEFENVGNCNFPKLIKFCPLDDLEYKKPRLTIEIEYELK
ncbi:MAG TPA: hypothetical protein ENG87_01590 [Candidatus Pacearchaeota archaeon]|nr:hypothetical protein [Candidatus Pacearchaeota archaeon]